MRVRELLSEDRTYNDVSVTSKKRLLDQIAQLVEFEDRLLEQGLARLRPTHTGLWQSPARRDRRLAA